MIIINWAGFLSDINGDLYCIEVDKIMEAFRTKDFTDEDDEPNPLSESVKAILNKLKFYGGYDIYI